MRSPAALALALVLTFTFTAAAGFTAETPRSLRFFPESEFRFPKSEIPISDLRSSIFSAMVNARSRTCALTTFSPIAERFDHSAIPTETNTAKAIKAAINATHNFVNLKFELQWMFFILLFSHRIQTTLTTAIKTEVAQLKSPRIYSHNYNLLLFLQKARTLL